MITPSSPMNSSLRMHADALAEAIVARQYQLQPDIWQRYGEAGRVKSIRDARYHLDYLAEALDANAPELFIAYLAWVKVLFAGLHFPESVLPATLECTRQVLADRLPEEERSPVLEIIDHGVRSLEDAPVELPSYLTGETPLDQLARRYQEALLSGDRLAASQMILRAVDQGTLVKEIYLRVFQRSQHEIGRLWQTNQISVAQEHYCTAATQFVMSQLYPHIFAAAKKGHVLVATCVGGELHEIGMRMVADFLEMDGWDTHFLGANTPTASILSILAERRARILAVSATMTFHVERVRELVAATRNSGLNVHIVVGGYPFNLAPRLWESVGADGYAPDAQAAAVVAEKLVPV